eukprot:6991218-Prymnesium_polylepis.1
MPWRSSKAVCVTGRRDEARGLNADGAHVCVCVTRLTWGRCRVSTTGQNLTSIIVPSGYCPQGSHGRARADARRPEWH